MDNTNISNSNNQNSENESKNDKIEIKNPFIKSLNEDYLLHFNLSTAKHNFRKMFGDVKFVCMGGSAQRMKKFVHLLHQNIYSNIKDGPNVENIIDNGYRYSMYKIGCVLCVNHGIGLGSVTIVLNEIIKLLYYANAKKPLLFRVGTSGGILAPTGTVVITNEALNDYLEASFNVPIFGKKVTRPAIVNKRLIKELEMCSKNVNFPVIVGKTMTNEHFYEVHGMDIISEYSGKERKLYFDLLKQNYIMNVDMEAIAVTAITSSLGIPSAIITVVMNNVVEIKEKVTLEKRAEWETRPQIIIAKYIEEYLSKSS